MKTALLLSCLLWVNLLHAKDKDLDKIRKTYASGKFDKVIKMCDKELASTENKRNPEFYLYKSLSIYKQADSSSTTYFKMITAALAVAAKGITYDKALTHFNKQNSDFNQFIFVAHKQAEIKYYSNKLKEAKAMEGSLAKSFKDTSDLYRVLYNVAPTKKEEIISKPVEVKLKSNAGKIDSMVYFASLQVGKEYKYAKEGPDAFDCSGFIGYVFKAYGEKLPHNAHLISKLGEEVAVENLKKGDLIFFGNTSAYHVAMYVGETEKEPKIIHCVSRGVCIDDFTATTHWGKSNVYKIKRLIK